MSIFFRNRSHKQPKTRGFTIVELLVVLTIIGILAVVGNVAYDEVQKTARDEIRMTEVTQISLALAAYKSEFGYYPRQADNYSGHTAPPPFSTASALSNCAGNHLGRIFADPADSVCGSLNPLSSLLAEYAGQGFQDPRYNDDLSGGGWDDIYWYYYNGRGSCTSDYDIVTIRVRQMETDKYPNVNEIEDLCDPGSLGEEGGHREYTYIHVIDWISI